MNSDDTAEALKMVFFFLKAYLIKNKTCAVCVIWLPVFVCYAFLKKNIFHPNFSVFSMFRTKISSLCYNNEYCGAQSVQENTQTHTHIFLESFCYFKAPVTIIIIKWNCLKWLRCVGYFVILKPPYPLGGNEMFRLVQESKHIIILCGSDFGLCS